MKAKTATGAAVSWIGVKISAIKLITGTVGIFWPVALCVCVASAAYFSAILLTYKEEKNGL